MNGVACHHGQKPREDGSDCKHPEKNCFPTRKGHKEFRNSDCGLRISFCATDRDPDERLPRQKNQELRTKYKDQKPKTKEQRPKIKGLTSIFDCLSSLFQ